MEDQAIAEMLRFVQIIPDPRRHNVSHPLTTILIIAILAVMCGEDDWTDVEEWAKFELDWLKTFLDMPHGVPSHDTFDRVFSLIDPVAFEKGFMEWTAQLNAQAGSGLVAIDGKTIRRSFEKGFNKTPIHMVSAYAVGNKLVLGQLKTEKKENEISVIPKLLALLNLKNKTVTIDAMGCQKAIAQQIVDQKGDYLLMIKNNHPIFFHQIEMTFKEARLEKFVDWNFDYFESVSKGHGRIDTRRVWLISDIDGMSEVVNWPGLQHIVVVESIRQGGKKDTKGLRFYLSSHKTISAEFAAHAIRSHWGIENGLHRTLDVSMNEDQCRIRKNNGAENATRIRRIVLNKLQRTKVQRPDGKIIPRSVKSKRRKCARERNFLLLALLS